MEAQVFHAAPKSGLMGMFERFTFFRYVCVSGANVATSQLLLFLFSEVLDWRPLVANVSSVILSTIPAYIMSRRWVWRQSGGNDFGAEVLPFWLMAALGLVLSTIAVTWAGQTFDAPWALNVASLGTYGFIWVMKYIVLDRLIWPDDD
jgi:putative flippase GtrA